MKPHLLLTGLATVAVPWLITPGCNSSGAQRNFTTIGKPAMPTIVPAEAGSRTGEGRVDVVATIMQLARRDDFSGAVTTLMAVNDLDERTRLSREIAASLADEQPLRAAGFATALPQGMGQMAAMDIVAGNLVKREPDAALHWAVNLPNAGAGRVARHAVAQHLVAVDPRPAIERIRKLSAGPARDDLLVAAAGSWARTDATGAVSWLREQPEDDLKPRLTSTIGLEIAQTRPERAVNVAEMLPAGRDRWLLFSAIAQTWVAVDSKAAMAWASQLPAGEPRDAALAGVDTGLGVPQRRRVAGAPGTRGGSSRTRGGGGALVSLPDPSTSPDFAAWLATQAPGMSKDEAIVEYVRQRGALEPQKIGQWLTTLPGGPAVDRAKEVYIENVVPTAPAEAARWLRSVPRSERTDEMVERTAKRWLQTSPDAAEAWLRDTTLPEFKKDRLLRDAGR